MMKIKTLSIVMLLAFANTSVAGSALALGGPVASAPGGVMLANVPTRDALGAVSEQEAKLWVLNAGYDQVSGLSREASGVYRGTALLGGNLYTVAVDVAGNVLGVKQ